MKKTICAFSVIAALLLHCNANAQFQFAYTLSTSTQAYVPLTNGFSLNQNHVWRGDTANYVVSPGFNFKLDTIDCSFAFFSGANTFTSDLGQNLFSGFNATETNIMDRGADSGRSLSPVRSEVDGVAGQRILKFEAYNAGFVREYNNLHTLTDSVCLQIWLYEGSNVVELHYGPSRVRNTQLYFAYGGGPLVYYLQDVTQNPKENGPIYVLAGLPTNPLPEQNAIVNNSLAHIVVPLHSWPADSTVYRFTPNKLATPDVKNEAAVKVYPTFCHDELTITVPSINTTYTYNIVAINGTTTTVRGDLKNGKNTIDISALAQGMYLAEVQNGSTKCMQKFIKM